MHSQLFTIVFKIQIYSLLPHVSFMKEVFLIKILFIKETCGNSE